MSVRIGPRLQAFFEEALPITIGTTRGDGRVQLNPVWYEYREGEIWLNGGPNRGWLRHMQRDPRVTLLLVDPANMFRWAQIQG
ncbi:MAG: pyridoxamine 5'-phosphate oxidase family protein, partial [Chloroflexota bacterium]|nr:pyridoxamine 5'-phosphate oxidase family protein [Chloroflexota bacterium]